MLVEFAFVALAIYLLLAAMLTFGHALYVAQGVQQAADVAAREISRTPLPANGTFEDGLAAKDADGNLVIFDERLLVYEVQPGENFFLDVVPTWPVLNQQLATLMITDTTPDGRRVVRYPGALLTDGSTSTGYTVGIPVVVSRAGGAETIRWVPVVEEIESAANPDPFQLSSSQRGLVALRINYPFQSASMSGFQHDETNREYPFEETIGRPNAADDSAVVELNPDDRPGELTGAPLQDGNLYSGTYGGQYGLGAQGALGSDELTGGRPVRPYRRVISGQAIYRREIFE